MEQLGQIADRQPRRHPGRVGVDALDRRDLGVVLVGDLADDFLQQILDRGEPGRAAVFVDDDDQVNPPGLHLPQQLVGGLAVRDEQRRAHGDLDRPVGPAFVLARNQILEEGDADDVVDVFADDRDPGEAAAQQQGDRLQDSLAALDPHHLGARNHDFADERVPQLEHRGDHVAFAALDHVPFLGQVDEIAKLRLRGKWPVAVSLARREGVAEQDERAPNRARQRGQLGGEPGRAPRDGRRVLASEGARGHSDQDVVHDRHGKHGQRDGGESRPECMDHDHGDQAGRPDLTDLAVEEQYGDVGRRITHDPRELVGAGAAFPQVLLDRHPGHARDRRVDAGQHRGDRQQQDREEEKRYVGRCHDGPVRSAGPPGPAGSARVGGTRRLGRTGAGSTRAGLPLPARALPGRTGTRPGPAHRPS